MTKISSWLWVIISALHTHFLQSCFRGIFQHEVTDFEFSWGFFKFYFLLAHLVSGGQLFPICYQVTYLHFFISSGLRKQMARLEKYLKLKLSGCKMRAKKVFLTKSLINKCVRHCIRNFLLSIQYFMQSYYLFGCLEASFLPTPFFFYMA